MLKKYGYPGPPVSRLVDQYGDLNFMDENVRLDNLYIRLMNEPTSTSTIVTFAPSQKQAIERGFRAKSYLVNERGVEDARITVFGNGGSLLNAYREADLRSIERGRFQVQEIDVVYGGGQQVKYIFKTMIWIVPPGAAPPTWS